MNQYVPLIILLAVFSSHCTSIMKGPEYYDPEILATHGNGEHYVGAETCLECHADIYASHKQTAHFHTSALASSDNIHGSFEHEKNVIELDEVTVEMVKEGDKFFQMTKDKSGELLIPPQAFDVVIGSGVKGQSYLTWKGENLFQLQASYFPPTGTWINSPGYPPQPIQRPVRDGCLKCHVTFATNRDFSGQGNRYDKEKMIYGISCEKCHNPSAKHVIAHRNDPDLLAPQSMLSFDSLSRQQRLDACAQCHSGPRAGIIKGNSFSYLTGEKLDDYSRNFYTGKQDSELDVHGNQYGLLTSSTCFQQSPSMDCVSCHDPHAKQRGNRAHFNQVCISCHQSQNMTCAAEPAVMAKMDNSCIACHMPTSPSQTMSFQLTGDSVETPAYVRTHLIDIYPEESWHQ